MEAKDLDVSESKVSKPSVGEGDDNIILIGMPGAGKSTLGVVLAKIMKYDFIDADILIQNQCDNTLQKMIDTLGPEGFIKVENEILSKLSSSHSVIATGGSAVYSDEAMNHLAEIGRVVYLRISYEEMETRLHDLQERGIVMRGGLGMSLHDIFNERLDLYEKYADTTIDVGGLTIMEAVTELTKAIL